MPTPPAIAFFVTPHGFGHAARAAAVMGELRRLEPKIELLVFTTVPKWFFEDSRVGPFDYFPTRTDVGLTQKGPFEEDLDLTVQALVEFWDDFERAVADIARLLETHRARLVVCDIAPLGIAAARRAGLPSVLIENFTWDWIYRSFLGAEPRLEEFALRNEELNAAAHLRFQVEPVCHSIEGSTPVASVSREPRQGRAEMRRSIGLRAGDWRKLVLLTMGGLGWSHADASDAPADFYSVFLGGVDSLERRGASLVLPDRSPLYPPDLIRAADLVVGKLGYSTVAECVRGGTPLRYLERPHFPESPVLAAYADRHLAGRAIDCALFDGGDWVEIVQGALDSAGPRKRRANGARSIALRLVERL
ncbi:MAG: hypothetical protein OES47_10025 [Acidobacteriota bacterium]|nr:hypothetical protein [Acidobacteriota bacterium]